MEICEELRYNLEKRYNKRYQASLIENSCFVQAHGLEHFMEQQKAKYICPKCGGIISICGNFNSKNDSRIWLGASAISESVDFRAFAVNVKAIAPTGELYQSGHAIWLAYHNLIQCTKHEFGCKF